MELTWNYDWQGTWKAWSGLWDGRSYLYMIVVQDDGGFVAVPDQRLSEDGPECCDTLDAAKTFCNGVEQRLRQAQEVATR